MKKVVKVSSCLFIVIFIKLCLSFVVNEFIIVNYNKNIYDTKLIKVLYIMNINQSYIVYYNHGNLLYKTNNYDDAILKYEESLKRNPPNGRVCDIRINLSLSLVKKLSLVDDNEKIEILNDAKENLYKDKCANENDDNGRSEEAENLEKEIDELIRNLNNASDDFSSDDKEENDNDNEISSDEKKEEQLKDSQREANKKRQEDLEKYDSLDNYDYNYGKNW